MRIGYDARLAHGNISGVGHYTLNLLLTLAELDKSNEYIVLVRDSFPHKLPQNFTLLRYPHYPLSFRTLYLLRRKLTRFQLDLFHSTYFLSPLNLDCKTVVTAHDVALLWPNYFRGRNWAVQAYARQFVRFALRKSFDKASRIIAVSQQVKNGIRELELADDSKVAMVPASINLSINQSGNKTPPLDINLNGKPIILTVGNTRPPKNWFKLIRSFQLLRDKLGNGTLVLISSDDRNLESIKSLLCELGLGNDSVNLLGYRPQHELVKYYHSANLFVFPSLYEGFGLPPLEAMSCGLPVVASDRGALREVLGDAAYYVNPESVEDIASGIQKVLENSELRTDLIQKGYEQVKKYSWEKTSKQILDVYREVYEESKK